MVGGPLVAASGAKTLCAAIALIAACVLAGCGPPTGVVPTSERPNVILLLTDDLDARLLEDHSANYPNLSKLAAEGTTSRCMGTCATAPRWTPPSKA